MGMRGVGEAHLGSFMIAQIILQNDHSETVIFCPHEELNWWLAELERMPVKAKDITFNIIDE